MNVHTQEGVYQQVLKKVATLLYTDKPEDALQNLAKKKYPNYDLSVAKDFVIRNLIHKHDDRELDYLWFKYHLNIMGTRHKKVA